MKNEEQIKDVLQRMVNAYNDSKNTHAQHIILQSMQALEWVLDYSDTDDFLRGLEIYERSRRSFKSKSLY